MKTVSRFISAAILLSLSAGLFWLARTYPVPFGVVYPQFSTWILGVLGNVSGGASAPIWIIGLAVIVVFAIYTLVRAICKGKFLRWLAGLAHGVSFLIFAFVLLWGVGHALPTKTERIVTVEKYSAQTLQDATEYYGAQLDLYASQMARDEKGNIIMPAFEVLAEEAEEVSFALSARYPTIPAAELKVKKLPLDDVFGHLGITGIFVPITAESSVSGHTYAPSLPHTMCHELAHRLGCTAEEDANFIGYLACLESDETEFLYSAAYSAFIYCFNALYEADETAANTVWSHRSDLARRDISGANDHYEPYEGTVQDVSQKFNDTYLKLSGEEAGVKSYDLVSDALVAWYLKNKE
ncbi:MAG: DUF3810 domain-containing protein [Oscillospiraceae bacterium]|nr:DUF3810 domain-containing protein [Oscillospiraceae bacterium]